jgi:15,16-dihydrobiliverdin:ferredoxin oxidoreductase
MDDEKKYTIRFNRILREEMSRVFELKELPMDPDFKLMRSTEKSKGAVIKSEHLACPKTGGIRMGEMDYAGSMIVHFGSIPPGKTYDFPIFGFTFVYASKFLIAVLDLHPVSKDREYMGKYIEPLKDIPERYSYIPQAEGGRREVHDWAKRYDSGYALYRWCDGHYLPDVEKAFKDYLAAFCDCIKKAEPVTDPEVLALREKYLEDYRYDYAYKDPGSSPLKSYFGEERGERFMKEFLFAP